MPFLSVHSLSFGMLLLRRSSDTGQGSSRPDSAQQDAAPASLLGGSSLDASNAAPHRSTSGTASVPVASSELNPPVPKAEEQKGPSKSPAAQPTAKVAQDIAAAVSSSSQDDASPEAGGRLEEKSRPKPEAEPAKGAISVPEEGCSPSEPIKAGLGEAKGAASSVNTNGHPTPEPNALPASKGKAKHSTAQESSPLSGTGSAPKTAKTHTPSGAKSAKEPASAAEQSPSELEPTAVGGQAAAMPATPASMPGAGSAPKTAQTYTPMPKATSAIEPASAAEQRPSHNELPAVDGEAAAGAMGAMPASANGAAEPTKESSAAKDAASEASLSKGSTAAATVTSKTPPEKMPPAKTPPEKTPAAQDVKEAKVSMQESCRPLLQCTCPARSSSAGVMQISTSGSAKWNAFPDSSGETRRDAQKHGFISAGASRRRHNRQWPCHCSHDTSSRAGEQEQCNNASQDGLHCKAC